MVIGFEPKGPVKCSEVLQPKCGHTNVPTYVEVRIDLLIYCRPDVFNFLPGNLKFTYF